MKRNVFNYLLKEAREKIVPCTSSHLTERSVADVLYDPSVKCILDCAHPVSDAGLIWRSCWHIYAFLSRSRVVNSEATTVYRLCHYCVKL